MTPRRPGPPLFPYTTLFRSWDPPQRPGRWVECHKLRRSWTRGTGPDEQVVANASEEGKNSRDARMNGWAQDRKSTRLNSSHLGISYAVFCLKKKKKESIRSP